MTVYDAPAGGWTKATGMARFGPLLGTIWIVFLAEPLRAAADAPNPALRVVGVAGVVGLAVLFAWSLLRFRARQELSPQQITLFVVGQLVCVTLTSLAAAQQGLVGIVFVCATLVLIAPRRVGLSVVAALVVALYLLPRVVPGWQAEDSTVVSAVLASLAVLGFRGAIERNRKLVIAQEEVAVLAVSRERERIARDMHDILGHSLTVVSVKAELAARLLRTGGPARTPQARRAADELAEIQALARSTLADMRGMVAGERQVTLAGELAAARSAFDAAGIAADLPGAVDEVAEEYRDVFAWALREGTTNVLRHAAARRVVVVLRPASLVMDDDGRGLDPGRPASSGGGGNGLPGLTDRAGAVGLVVETGPSPLGGLRLAVRGAHEGAAPDAAPHDGEDSV